MIEQPVPPQGWTARTAGDQLPGLPVPTYLGELDDAKPTVRRTRAQLVLSGLLVLALAAGGLLLALGGTKDASGAVSLAARTSTAATSAHITVSGSLTVKGTSIPISGSGGIDFANSAAQLTLTTTALGQSVTEKTLYVAGAMYLQLPEAAQSQLGSLLGGKSWISLNLSSLGGAAAGDGLATGTNPAAWLQLLTQRGATVTTLGASTVDGTAVQGYSVTLSTSVIKSEITSANLPSWIGQAIAQATFGPIAMKVYVNNANLVRRMTTTLDLSVGSTGSFAMHESTTFSSYGTPVSVSAPPSTQVVTFAQALKGFGSSFASGSGGGSANPT